MAELDDIDAQSVCSASSAASSVHEILVHETDRRKMRLRRIRSRKKVQESEDDSYISQSDLSIASSVSGIMSVRTLEESLDGGRITQMRKLRRQITIKFKSGADSTSVLGEDESISLGSRSTANISIDFSKVHIREYELVPGYNPSCTSGPPIELGWKHAETQDFDIESFEDVRDGRRRLQAQMRIPADIRRGMLLHHGNSQKHIRDATRSTAISRKERMQTLDKITGTSNGISVKKLFKFGKKKK
jgi:hypothetical protein